MSKKNIVVEYSIIITKICCIEHRQLKKQYDLGLTCLEMSNSSRPLNVKKFSTKLVEYSKSQYLGIPKQNFGMIRVKTQLRPRVFISEDTVSNIHCTVCVHTSNAEGSLRASLLLAK